MPDETSPDPLDHVDPSPHHLAIRRALAESEVGLREALMGSIETDPAAAAVVCAELLRLESWLPVANVSHPSAGPEVETYADRVLGEGGPTLDPTEPRRADFAVYANRARAARATLKRAEELLGEERARADEALQRLVHDELPDFVAEGGRLRAASRRVEALDATVPWLEGLVEQSRSVLEREAARLLLLRERASALAAERGSHELTVKLAAEGNGKIAAGVNFHEYYVYEPLEGWEKLVPGEYLKPVLAKKTLPSGGSVRPPEIAGLRVERRIKVEVRD